MTVQEAINKIVSWAEAQVGYKAGSGKNNKYAEWIDKQPDFYNGKKNHYDWCDVFVDVGFCQTFTVETARKMLYQPKKSTGAGCGFSASFYRANGAWAKNPQKGAQIFYGPYGNESHTGIVVDIQGNYVYTVEGNTGGGDGQVQRKKLLKTSSSIAGYGIPNWSLVAKNFTKQWGIDISGHQGNFNMAKAQKEGVRFCIIRGGGGDDGLYKDNRYEENYQKAKALKIPVGVYWMSKALTETQAKSEAEFFYQNCLKGKQFELPIYIDVENKTQLALGKKKLTAIIKTWLKYIRDKGFWVGLYSYRSAFETYMNDDELKNYAHWIAHWVKDQPKYTPAGAFGIWQFGGETNRIRSTRVADNDPVDQDYLLIDYETQIKAKGLNGWGQTPTPAPKPKLDVDGIGGYNTVMALQKWRGTYPDGEITGQSKAQSKYYPALVAVKYGNGSSTCISSIQKWLISQGYSCGGSGADGIIGKDTASAWQKWLIKNKYLTEADQKKDGAGVIGTNTMKAIQRYLNKVL